MMDYKEQGLPTPEGETGQKHSELVNDYPIFNKVDLDGTTIYIEESACSEIPEGEDRFRDEDARFFLMPSGPVLLSSPSLIYSEYLWNISEENKDVLNNIEGFVKEHMGDTKPSIFRMGNQRNYTAEVLSYDDPESKKRLDDLLDDKQRKRRANSK